MADSSIMDPRRPQNPLLRALDKGLSGVGEGAYRMGSTAAAGYAGLLHSSADLLGNIGEPNFLERAKGSLEKGGRTTEHILKALEDMGPHTMYHDDAVNAADEGMAAPGKAVGAAADWLGNHVGAGAGLAAGVIGDAGLNFLGPKEKGFEPLEFAKGKTWDALTASEARAAAVRGEHLRPGSGGKGFVGAPEWIKNKRDLNKFRRDLDKRIADGSKVVIDNKGTKGGEWYDEGAGKIAEIANTPEEATREAGLQGVYSANRPVPTAVNITRQHTTRAALGPLEETLEGLPALDRQKGEGIEIDQGLRNYPHGHKVGPFGMSLDPFYTGEHNRAVIDTRIAHEVFGYNNFGHDTQHSFANGEMLAAHHRAMEKGVLPPDSKVGAAQAAAWATTEGRGGENSAESLGSLLHKHALNVTYEPGSPGMPRHLEGLNDRDMNARREHADNMAAAPPGKGDPYYEALRIPQEGRSTGIGSWPTEVPDKPPFESAIMDPKTGENFTGNMHFDAMLKMPADSIARFDEHPETFPNGFLDPKGDFLSRDEAYSAAKQLPDYWATHAGNHFGKEFLASEDVRGANRGMVQRTQNNPLHVAHPLMEWDSPEMRRVLDSVEGERALVTGQAGYGWNRVKPLPKNSAHLMNALDIELPQTPSDLEIRNLYGAAKKAGLNLLHDGDSKFTLTGNDWAGTEPTDFQAKLNSPAAARLKALGGSPGTLESDFKGIDYGNAATDWKPQGTATEQLLNRQEPYIGKQLDKSDRLKQWFLDMNKAETQADMGSAGALKSGPQPSLHNLRAFIAEHGREGLRETVTTVAKEEGFFKPDGKTLDLAKAAASMGLPAALIVNALGDDQ